VEPAPVEIRRNEGAHRFEAVIDGEVAFAEYRLLPEGVLFPHTVVPEAMEGQGIGSALVRAGLDWAREQALEVMPACSFFAAYVKRHPEVQDLVAPDWRPRLGLG
jgi:predicted GNAT family acetyltransferase